MLGERTRVLHRRFDIIVQFIEPVPFVCYPHSILCPLGPGALSGSKKLKRVTVLIQKEPVSWNFVRPN